MNKQKKAGFCGAILLRIISILMLSVMCVCAFASFALPSFADDRVNFSDGSIYRFKNKKTGMYLDCYNYAVRIVNKTFLANADSSVPGQFFRLAAGENNTWKIIPRSESEKYVLGYSQENVAGSEIVKMYATQESELTYFEFTYLPGGYFTISPSNGSNVKAVVAVSDEKAQDGKTLVKIADYVYGDESQLWYAEPVTTEKLTAAFSWTRVRLYTTGTLYARKYPDNGDTSDIVWTSDNEEVLLISESGDYCALSEGTANVTASVDGCSVTMQIDVVDSYCFTWYSQTNMYSSNWNAENLGKLRFVADGKAYLFAVDLGIDYVTSNWIIRGCSLCSAAMVLHNLGATMTIGYDLRSGQNGNLPADPYTVALANSGNVGPENIQNIYGNPVYMHWSYVAGRFTVDGEAVEFRKASYPTRLYVKKEIEKHPAGVIICLDKAGETHFMVAAGVVDPDETVSSKIEFIVYDPAGYVPQRGDGIPYSQTATAARTGYISGIFIFDVESSFD